MYIRTYSAKTRIATVVIVAFIIVLGGAVLAWFLPSERISYNDGDDSTASNATTTLIASTTPPSPPPFVVTHVPAPIAIRAAYYTSWAAGTPSFQKQMFSLIQGTDLNSLVIDVKDYSGRIGFDVTDPDLVAVGSAQNRIPDIEHMIDSLHKQGIYVIGRVAVFQDPFIVKIHPEWAVHNKTTGAVWRDSGGAYWVDPDNKDMWSYVAEIAKQAYAVGFDEINFDYVRFPSDGIGNAAFAKSASTTKETVITRFFSYIHDQLSPLGIPISADIFGQTTSDLGDMGIGQHFENVLPYFDYVDPMVYPSHYVDGFLNFAKPAEHPYAIVKYELGQAVDRTIAASSSPDKIRPWLQAFDLGAIYTPDMVHEQMQASADAGTQGWLLWNAGSVYNREFVMPFASASSTAEKMVIGKLAATTTAGAQ